jgi:O-antigen ligase
MRNGTVKAQTAIFEGQLLAAGVLMAWLLAPLRIEQLGPASSIAILALLVLALFIFAAKSLYQRLACTMAFQAFALQSISVAGIYISAPDIMLLLLLIEASFTLKPRKQTSSKMGMLAIGLLITTCISIILSPVLLHIIGSSLRYVALLILFIALDRVEFSADSLLVPLRGMALAFPLALILFYFNGDLAEIVSSVEAGGRPMHSQTLPLLYTLMFPYYVLGHGHPAALPILACVYAGIAWVGQSRAMIVVAFIVLLIISAVKLRRNQPPLLTSLVVVIVGLAAANYVIGIEGIEEALASRPGGDEWRLHKMDLLLESFKEYPIFGMGPGSEVPITQQRYDEAMASENGFVQSLAESGVAGTTIFLALVLSSLAQCYHLAKRRIIGRDLAGGLMIMVVAAMAPLSYGSGVRDGIVWLILAIVNQHIRSGQSATLMRKSHESVLEIRS